MPRKITNMQSIGYSKIFKRSECLKQAMGCRHGSVDSSVPSILPPRVRVPSTPSMLLSIYILQFTIYILHLEKMKIKREVGIGPFFLKKHKILSGNFSYMIGAWTMSEIV